MKYCHSCGKAIENNNAKFCPECGKSIGRNSSSLKKWIIALTISFSLCALFFVMLISVLVFENDNPTQQQNKLSNPTNTTHTTPATKLSNSIKTNTPQKPVTQTEPHEFEPVNSKTFICSEYEFLCKIPEGWRTIYKNDMVFIQGPKNTPSQKASIVMQRFFYSVQRHYTLKDLGFSVINQCSKYPNYRLIEDNQTENTRKTVVEFFKTDENKMFKYEQVLLKNNGRIYAIAFVVPSDIYDLYHDVMVTAVKTFKTI